MNRAGLIDSPNCQPSGTTLQNSFVATRHRCNDTTRAENNKFAISARLRRRLSPRNIRGIMRQNLRAHNEYFGRESSCAGIRNNIACVVRHRNRYSVQMRGASARAGSLAKNIHARETHVHDVDERYIRAGAIESYMNTRSNGERCGGQRGREGGREKKFNKFVTAFLLALTAAQLKRHTQTTTRHAEKRLVARLHAQLNRVPSF